MSDEHEPEQWHWYLVREAHRCSYSGCERPAAYVLWTKCQRYDRDRPYSEWTRYWRGKWVCELDAATFRRYFPEPMEVSPR